MNQKTSTDTLIANLPVGLGVFEVGESKINPLYYSNEFCNILGINRKSFGSHINEKEPAGLISGMNIPNLLQTMKERKPGETGQHITEATKGNGDKITIEVVYKYVSHDERSLFYCVARDITEEREKAKRANWQSESFKLLIASSNFITFDYDPFENVMTYSVKSNENGVEEVHISNYLEHISHSQIIHDDYKQEYKEVLSQACSTPMEIEREYVANNFGKGYQWCKAKLVSIADEDGQVYRVVGIVEDIERQKQREEALLSKAAREASYRKSLTEGAIVFVEYNLTTGERIASESDIFPFAKMEKMSLTEAFEILCQSATHPEDVDELLEFSPNKVFQSLKSEQNQEMYCEFRTASLSGKYEGYRWVSMSISFSIDTISLDPHVFICIRDIDEEKKDEINLKEISERDSLTHLLNRASFESLTKACMLAATKSDLQTAFLMIDLDDFKSINDNYGHAKGDAALEFMARRLKSVFRSDDIIGRIGGDEFAVFLPNIPSEELAAKKGYEICTSLNSSRKKEFKDINISCSVGIAISPKDGRSFQELYQKADLALYEAKDMGKNQCVIYDSERMVPRVGQWMNKEWILDAISDSIYISDTETYEIYYMNKPMCEKFNIKKYKGKKCYELLQGRKTPCPFCTNSILNYEEFYYWEFTNPKFKIKTLLRDKLINWSGKVARMEVVTEVNDEQRKTYLKEDNNRQKIDAERYRILINYTDLMPFEYDAIQDKMTYTFRKDSREGEETVITNYIEHLELVEESNVLVIEEIRAYVSQLRKALLHPGEGHFEFSADFNGNGNYTPYRADYFSIGDDRGRVYRVVGRFQMLS